jgi:hypothetical protein
MDQSFNKEGKKDRKKERKKESESGATSFCQHAVLSTHTKISLIMMRMGAKLCKAE